MKKYLKSRIIKFLKPIFKNSLEKAWNEGYYCGNTRHISNKLEFNKWFNNL